MKDSSSVKVPRRKKEILELKDVSFEEGDEIETDLKIDLEMELRSKKHK